VVLAGGRTPLAAYRLLRDAQIDGDRWHLFFGDERCLRPGDAERNSRAAWEAWLDGGAIPVQNIHVIPAEHGPEEGARRYAEAIAPWLPFDLVLLGMGEDGHVASLFPGQRHPPDALAVPVHDAPKPPTQRVSLNQGVICGARERLLLVTGAGKAAALAAWQAGDDLPVARVAACGALTLLLDEAAAR